MAFGCWGSACCSCWRDWCCWGNPLLWVLSGLECRWRDCCIWLWGLGTHIWLPHLQLGVEFVSFGFWLRVCFSMDQHWTLCFGREIPAFASKKLAYQAFFISCPISHRKDLQLHRWSGHCLAKHVLWPRKRKINRIINILHANKDQNYTRLNWKKKSALWNYSICKKAK